MAPQRPKTIALPDLSWVDAEDSKTVFEAFTHLVRVVERMYRDLDIDLRDLEARVTALEP